MSSRVEPATEGVDPAVNLGSRLRQARLDSNMTLRELARTLGVSPSFVSQLENGKSQPSVATLYSLAQLLGVSIDRLFDGVGDPAPTAAAPVVEPPAPDDSPPVDRARLASPADAFRDGAPQQARLSVTTPGNRTRLVMDTGVIWEQLARNTDEHMDFMEITYPAGSSSTTDDRMMRHDGYEYGFLLEGELQVTLGFDEFTLRAGEAIGLNSSLPHLFKNLGTTPARGIWFVHHRHD
jgi:transcriptional regulator with XRE-family HTH domain/quercetin dioxygenase-like cupin family protein